MVNYRKVLRLYAYTHRACWLGIICQKV